jgi:hypothetical protein
LLRVKGIVDRVGGVLHVLLQFVERGCARCGSFVHPVHLLRDLLRLHTHWSRAAYLPPESVHPHQTLGFADALTGATHKHTCVDSDGNWGAAGAVRPSAHRWAPCVSMNRGAVKRSIISGVMSCLCRSNASGDSRSASIAWTSSTSDLSVVAARGDCSEGAILLATHDAASVLERPQELEGVDSVRVNPPDDGISHGRPPHGGFGLLVICHGVGCLPVKNDLPEEAVLIARARPLANASRMTASTTSSPISRTLRHSARRCFDTPRLSSVVSVSKYRGSTLKFLAPPCVATSPRFCP